MIVIEDNRTKSIYIRQNRRVQWRYAEYCGRYETEAEAIENAKDRCKEPFEYRIEDMSGTIITGFVGWYVEYKTHRDGFGKRGYKDGIEAKNAKEAIEIARQCSPIDAYGFEAFWGDEE